MPSLKTRDTEWPIEFKPPALQRIADAGLTGIKIADLASGEFFSSDKAAQKRQVLPLMKAILAPEVSLRKVGDEDLAVMVGSNIDRVMDCLRRGAIAALPDAEQGDAIAKYKRETRRQWSSR